MYILLIKVCIFRAKTVCSLVIYHMFRTYIGKINHLPRTRQQSLQNTVSKQYENIFSTPQNTSISIIL